jgi:hypothetical protein
MNARAALLGILLILGEAGVAAAGGLTVRLGGFWPRGESTLFQDVEDIYTLGDPDVGVSASDFSTFTGGIEYSMGLGPLLELGLHADVAEETLHTSLRDYVDDDTGQEIRQSLKLSVVPVGVTFRLIPTGRVRVAPYLAAGVDAFFWKYEEWGEFVDVFDRQLEIVEDWFIADGVAVGGHVAGGLRLALNDDFSLVGEARYQFSTQDMGDDFGGSRIDLSGFSATAGLHLRF